MHISVLLNESIESLKLKDNSIVVDCTLGYGGHSSKILEIIKNGYLYCFDQDKKAIEYSDNLLKKVGHNYKIIHSNFVSLKEELEKLNIKKVDAILFDLGVSSPQLDNTERGFSFHNDARLDMRMNQENKLDAHYVVNNYSKEDLIKIFREYGEEKYASSIADKICKYRQDKVIETTLELVDIIKMSVPYKYSKDHHPARKVFQAIRIEVNDELNVLSKVLDDALDLLNIDGRLSIITFHSLEDKIVKYKFNEVSTVKKELAKLPIIPEKYLPNFKIIDNISPDKLEIENNQRSRSSRLRIIEKIK